MPVALSDEEALAWLGDEPLADDQLLALCRGLPAEALQHEEIAAKPKASRHRKKFVESNCHSAHEIGNMFQ